MRRTAIDLGDPLKFGAGMINCYWTPDVASSLFTEKTPEGVITEWKQPTGAHDAYNTGD